MTLSDAHRAYLRDHAVADEVTEAAGISSDGDWIIFPWQDENLSTVQRRQWPEPEGGAEGPKYLWEAGRPLHFAAWRPVQNGYGPVLIVEGTKQSLCAASWAPPEYAVYGMAGCDGWRNLKVTRLNRFEDRDVVIILDADAGSNLNVYEAGEKLGQHLTLEGAAKVSFVHAPAAGKDGLDDVLAEIPEEERAQRLRKMISRALPKPALSRPRHRPPQDPGQPDTGGRPLVIVNRDKRDVIHAILGLIRERWDGRDLFCFGGALTRLRDAKTEPLDKDAFMRWLSECVATYKYTPPGLTGPARFEPAWPDPQTIGALLASADEFTVLSRISRTPFIRPDGTVCGKSGYDQATGTMLITGNSGMDRLDIPEAPSRDEAREAARFLLDEWLGDMPFRDQASRANALALVLTPFVRGLVPLVPLAVMSGLQPGVGKNLLADCISLMVTGENALPMSWAADDEAEMNKKILAAFREGTSLLIFDEAHDIKGAALTRAITATTFVERILGVSKMASFPNRVTWMSLGNQVTVHGDMARRGYPVEMYPDVPDPENRPESDFAHPDLREWTLANRPALVTAALAVLRSWYAAGCPRSYRGSLMGSFEAWDKIMSGVLAWCGTEGFLSNLAEWRAGQDQTGGFWSEHLAWLAEKFGTETFTAIDVRARAMGSGGTWDSPPGLDDAGGREFARDLGTAYARQSGRWYGNLRIVRMGLAHRKVAKWMVQVLSATGGVHENPNEKRGGADKEHTLTDLRRFNSTPSLTCEGGSGGSGGTSLAANVREENFSEARTTTRNKGLEGPSTPSSPSAAVFDLETGDGDRLFTYPRGEFVRLAGILDGDGLRVVPVPELIAELERAPEISGHNILGFDLLALAWHHGADYLSLAAKARDTELIARQADPPRSRDSHSADSYDLTTVAQRLGLPGKTDDLKRLKQEHGGYDKIPQDDPEYRSYLEGDLRASAAVIAEMSRRYGPDPYVKREHVLARLAGQMTLNGFRVDQELLQERYEAGEKRKRDCLQVLHDGWGLPLTKTVSKGRGKAKTETEENVPSPLSTDAGRAWLEKFWTESGLDDPPRTQKTGKLSISADDMKAIAARRPDLAVVCNAIGIVVSTRTVYQTARECLAEDGRVHPRVSFRQASGRWSVTNPGLTVFGKRGGRHVERDIFLPDEGHVLLSFDLSQVDMRAMAWLSGDHAYRAMFAEGRDAHKEIAAQVGITRQDAKAIGHGWNYGLGPKKMIASGLDPDLVYAFIRGMEERFPQLIAWREQIREQGRAGMILDNGFGRRMACDPQRAYTVAPALMGQGGARDIMCTSLLRLPGETWPMLRVMVHDEIVLSVPRDQVVDVAQAVKAAMTWQLDDDLPVLCDMSGGANWGEASRK